MYKPSVKKKKNSAAQIKPACNASICKRSYGCMHDTPAVSHALCNRTGALGQNGPTRITDAGGQGP
jgi:hypothetical protein